MRVSADNFILIRRTPEGKFVLSNVFASDGRRPKVEAGQKRYDRLDSAYRAAMKEDAEYGVRVDDSCWIGDGES